MMYLLYKIGSFLAVNLPLQYSYWLANTCGSCYYFLAKKDREIVKNNLKVVLNHTGNTDKIEYTSRMVFVNFARYLVEFFRSSKTDGEFVKHNVSVEGIDNLKKALKLGKGALLVSAHLGNWELGAQILSALGYKISAIAWTHKSRAVNNFFLGKRRNNGVGTIPLGKSILRVFRALKSNECIAILGDIDYSQSGNGITAKLFRHDAIMPRGPALFSLKTGAPVVPVFALRQSVNKFRLILSEPIVYIPTQDRKKDLASLTQEITAAIESHIVMDPAQWFMLKPRW